MNHVEWVKNSFTGGHWALRGEKSSQPFVNPMKSCAIVDLRHDDIVADVGAFVGEYSMWAAPQVERVRSFEAAPETFHVLSRNVLDRDFTNWTIYNKAVTADDAPRATLHLSKGIGATNSIAKSYAKAGSIQVDAIRYEEAIRGCTVVKIDVEGAEYLYDIIQPDLRAVVLEFHPVAGIDWKRGAEMIMENLKDSGFRPLLVPGFTNGWDTNSAWERS